MYLVSKYLVLKFRVYFKWPLVFIQQGESQRAKFIECEKIQHSENIVKLITSENDYISVKSYVIKEIVKL